jgi:hypothetical protein
MTVGRIKRHRCLIGGSRLPELLHDSKLIASVNVKRRKTRLDLDGRFDSRDRLVVPANPGLRVTEAGKQSGGIGRQLHRPAGSAPSASSGRPGRARR